MLVEDIIADLRKQAFPRAICWIACRGNLPLQSAPPGSDAPHLLIFDSPARAPGFLKGRRSLVPVDSAPRLKHIACAVARDARYQGPPNGLLLNLTRLREEAQLTLGPQKVAAMDGSQLATALGLQQAVASGGHEPDQATIPEPWADRMGTALVMFGALFAMMVLARLDYPRLRPRLHVELLGTTVYLSWLVVAPIQWAVAVAAAEAPRPRLARILRGALAGLLFNAASEGATALLLTVRGTTSLTNMGWYLYQVGMVLSGILAAMAIDYPRYRWPRLILFAVASFGPWRFVPGLSDAFDHPLFSMSDLLSSVFVGLGYGLVPRGSVHRGRVGP